MSIFLVHENLIRDDWKSFRTDPDNPRKDIETPDEWIAEAKAGNITMFGAKVVIHNKLLKFRLPA